MKNFDPYKILEVNNRASSTVIKAAYQALMKKYHPDHDGNEQIAKDINVAYAILSNDSKRKGQDENGGDL